MILALLVDLMTRGAPNPAGKVLIIGGGIANFTNVASTFKGIIQALKQYQYKLQEHKVRVFVRRGGPNYQEGLKAMRLLGETLGIEIQVYVLSSSFFGPKRKTDASRSFDSFGPESHITAIVPLALGITKATGPIHVPELDAFHPVKSAPAASAAAPANGAAPVAAPSVPGSRPHGIVSFDAAAPGARPWYRPFDENTRSLVYGLQPRAIQGMLDFDFACGRKTPSVAAMIYPFGGHHVQKFYWGTAETLLPVFTSMAEAVQKCPDADVVVNFASSRSVYQSTLECLEFPSIKAIALIAEGVPERHAREILWAAQKKNVLIIGPATVGGIKPGCFRIGNTGGFVPSPSFSFP